MFFLLFSSYKYFFPEHFPKFMLYFLKFKSIVAIYEYLLSIIENTIYVANKFNLLRYLVGISCLL